MKRLGALAAFAFAVLLCGVALARKPIDLSADGGGATFPPEGFAAGADAALADSGSVQQQLSDVDKKRQELESVTRELDEERLRLEAQMRTAEERQNSTQLIVSLVLVAALGAGAWYVFSRRRREEE